MCRIGAILLQFGLSFPKGTRKDKASIPIASITKSVIARKLTW